ncbi:MAG TPA: hypothetical protein VGY58_01185, partial [Gemmataceae bacterium]|nr:hypothetical protein [Gemmataceae bacterium]
VVLRAGARDELSTVARSFATAVLNFGCACSPLPHPNCIDEVVAQSSKSISAANDLDPRPSESWHIETSGFVWRLQIMPCAECKDNAGGRRGK